MLDGAPASDWWVVLDVDLKVQVGQGWENTTELGIILAASLVDRGLRARHPQGVGLLASGNQTVWFNRNPVSVIVWMFCVRWLYLSRVNCRFQNCSNAPTQSWATASV